MKRNGHAEWLERMGEKIISAARVSGGLPSVGADGYMTVRVPTLREQSMALNNADDDIREILKTGVPKLG